MGFTRAAFICAALVLLVLLLQSLANIIFSSARPNPTPTPTAPPSAPPEPYTMAFFGSAADPFCAALFPTLDRLSEDNGWRLIRYDCRGNATSQRGQIEDFLRTETADIAVVYSVLQQDDLNDQVKALYKACPVVTVGNGVGTASSRYVAAHVGVDKAEQIRALASYFKGSLEQDSGILLIADIPDEKAESLYDQVLSEENVTVLGKNYSWGGSIYAERYLNTGVEDFAPVGGILCTSRHGTQGAENVLGEKGLRSGIMIASLSYEPAMADDLALGGLDAAVAFSAVEAGELLEEILPKGLNGEPMEKKFLTPILLTPENVDTVDLGY